jgi:hypothetical protein
LFSLFWIKQSFLWQFQSLCSSVFLQDCKTHGIKALSPGFSATSFVVQTSRKTYAKPPVRASFRSSNRHLFYSESPALEIQQFTVVFLPEPILRGLNDQELPQGLIWIHADRAHERV